MDGYVLPTFESTSIFKDKDIIRVRGKNLCMKEVTETVNLEEQPVIMSQKFLAIKNSTEDSHGYNHKAEDDAYAINDNTVPVDSLPDENVNSRRKRKHSDVLQDSKRKKLKSTSLDRQDVTSEEQTVTAPKSSHRRAKPAKGDVASALVASQANDEVKKTPVSRKPLRQRKKELKPPNLENQDGTILDAECNHVEQEVTTRKSSKKKKKPFKGSRQDVVVTSQDDGTDDKTGTPRKNRNDQDVAKCQTKLPSRSARRKKAKRQWLRDLRKTQLEEHKESQIPANDISRKSPEGERINQNNGTVTEDDTEVVPVVIRPGHIRFEPVDAEQSKEQPNGQVTPFQWNGTTSKKKGQKWGQEKTSRKIDDNAMDEDTTEKVKSGAGDGILVDAPIDFKCFLPLSRAPKEGDVIAYHLVVLSSAWCPELSSVRVGKVSSYDSISMRIVLSPVRGHPIFPGDENAECVSVYKEDGSLEIDFSSLVDVRLFKSLSSEETAVQREITEVTAPAPVSNLKMSEKVTPVNNWDSTALEDNLNVTVNNPAVATAPASSMKVALSQKTVTEKIAPVALSQETVAEKVAPVDTWEAAAPVNVPEKVPPVNYCEEVAAPVNVPEKVSSADICGEMNIANTSSTDKLESRAVNWEAPSSILDKKSDNWVSNNWGASSSNANKKPAPFSERSWGEQINAALIEKKAELEKNGGWGEENGGWGEKRAELQKNGGWGERMAEPQKNRDWGKKAEVRKSGGWKNWTANRDTTSPPWSYRVLRRSAVGPTMAFLRASKGYHA